MNYRADDILQMVKFAVASNAAAELTKHGGNGAEAARFMIDVLDKASQWMTPGQQAAPVLERAALLAHYGPVLLKAQYPVMEAFYRETSANVALVHELGRGLVAIDEQSIELVLLSQSRCAPFGSMSPLGYQRCALAASTAQMAYLLCSHVDELRAMPVLGFIHWMYASGARGQVFQSQKEQLITSQMVDKDLEIATMRGFSLGWDLATTQPRIDDLGGDDLLLTPYELHQLAYHGQRSGFKRINLIKELNRAAH